LNRSALYSCLVRSVHTRLNELVITDALQSVTGYLRHTPADNLAILAGIQPAELRRNGTTLSLARRAMEPGHLLHSSLTCSSCTDARRLKSRHPFVPAAQHLIRLAQWADHQWNAEWAAFSSPTPVPIPRNDPPKNSLGPA